jgi:triosephosphate isomerase
MTGGSDRPRLVVVSLKMYFSHARTLEWSRRVAELAARHPAVTGGRAELLVLPTFPSIPATLEIVRGVAGVGAQDLSEHDSGAFTGEVSGAELAEIGAVAAEVGHAERRTLFGETDAVVRAKTAAALRNGLTPVLCVGEQLQGEPSAAAEECIRQLDDALQEADEQGLTGRVVVAYEPYWAIGAASAAPTEHIRSVCGALRDHVRGGRRTASQVIYGGSAGPGLLGRLGDSVDGLFLGRFAHDPAAVESVLDEVLAL